MKNDLGREDFCVVGLPVRCQNDSDLPGSPTACGEGCWQWIIWVLWVVGRALVGFRCIPCEPDQALGSTMSALFLAALCLKLRKVMYCFAATEVVLDH